MDKTEAPELLETMAAQVEVGGKNGLAAVAERRAKIICTLGPSSNSEAMIRELLCAGMDVARLNFSHGTHEEHARVIERVRRAAEKEDRTVCILQDLQGPKMRTGRLKYRTPVALKTGSRVTITPRDVPGTTSVISTTFQDLAREVNTGSRILLSDGLIELRVKAIRNDDVECEVVNGGLLAEHQGINLPGAVLSVPSLTPKDYKDLEFGLEHGVDVVAVSFIRCAEDVRRVKRLIGERKSDVPVIAKLEKPQAVDDLDNILEAADGVMVARGDLGVEMPPETVPIIQKNVIRRAADFRKPVITATQMLESMIDNPRPTRAEASDVANAVFDGTDAVMLSGETASGRYPVEAVTIMARIVLEAEN
ncbi:MAG TPA: pyruvate kinase, partial [Terriglobales bacterium]|nr:pyruvate kinase [Terriglobales bacterium]